MEILILLKTKLWTISPVLYLCNKAFTTKSTASLREQTLEHFSRSPDMIRQYKLEELNLLEDKLWFSIF